MAATYYAVNGLFGAAVPVDQVHADPAKARIGGLTPCAGGRPRPAPRPRPPTRSSDSVGPAIGMDTTASQFSRTSRDRPLPSEPTTTTIGSVPSNSSSVMSLSGVEPNHLQAGVAPILQCPIEIRRPRHRHPRGRTRAGSPRHRGDRRRAPLRDQHAVAAERRHRTDDRAQVARIGDVVERHQQCRRTVVGRGREQVVGMGVLVGRHLQRDALVQAVGADPIEVAARHLEDRDAGIGCAPYGFGQSLVGLGAERDIQRGGGHSGAQTLQHRVAAEHDLGVVGASSAGGAVACFGARVWRPDGWAACARAAWRRGLPARGGELRPSRPSGPSSCRACGPRPGAGNCLPSTCCTRPAASTAARRRCR